MSCKNLIIVKLSWTLYILFLFNIKADLFIYLVVLKWKYIILIKFKGNLHFNLIIDLNNVVTKATNIPYQVWGNNFNYDNQTLVSNCCISIG